MAVHHMEANAGPRGGGRQQFRLRPIHHGPQHDQRLAHQYHDPNAAYYQYQTQYAQAYANPSPQYGTPHGGWAGAGMVYNPRQQAPQPAPAQRYVPENEGYTINGVWYPYQQPLHVPDMAEEPRTQHGRRGYRYPSDLRHGGVPDGFGGVVYGNNRGPPDPYQQPDVPIVERVRKQFEYYFSAKNLSGDAYMRGLMRNDGYIPLPLLMEFPRMKVHKISPALAVRAANESVHLKVLGIDYPLHPDRPRDYFIRTRHSWWKYVPYPENVPEEDKIEDDAGESIQIDSSEPPQRTRQSLLSAGAEEDTMIAPDEPEIQAQLNSLHLGPPKEEDTMN